MFGPVTRRDARKTPCIDDNAVWDEFKPFHWEIGVVRTTKAWMGHDCVERSAREDHIAVVQACGKQRVKRLEIRVLGVLVATGNCSLNFENRMIPNSWK